MEGAIAGDPACCEGRLWRLPPHLADQGGHFCLWTQQAQPQRGRFVPSVWLIHGVLQGAFLRGAWARSPKGVYSKGRTAANSVQGSHTRTSLNSARDEGSIEPIAPCCAHCCCRRRAKRAPVPATSRLRQGHSGVDGPKCCRTKYKVQWREKFPTANVAAFRTRVDWLNKPINQRPTRPQRHNEAQRLPDVGGCRQYIGQTASQQPGHPPGGRHDWRMLCSLEHCRWAWVPSTRSDAVRNLRRPLVAHCRRRSATLF